MLISWIVSKMSYNININNMDINNNIIINSVRVLIKLDIMKIMSDEEKKQIELLVPEIKEKRINNMNIFEKYNNILPFEIVLNIKKYLL